MNELRFQAQRGRGDRKESRGGIRRSARTEERGEDRSPQGKPLSTLQGVHLSTDRGYSGEKFWGKKRQKGIRGQEDN